MTCCTHPRIYHCRPGGSGLWIREGRFKRLVRCQHSGAFAEDDRTTCTDSKCAVPGCDCAGWPEPKPRKKEKDQEPRA